MPENLPQMKKTHYINIGGDHRKYFSSYREAKIFIDTHPILGSGKGKGIHQIYPVDTEGMGGRKKGNARLSYATKIGKQARKEKKIKDKRY